MEGFELEQCDSSSLGLVRRTELEDRCVCVYDSVH